MHARLALVSLLAPALAVGCEGNTIAIASGTDAEDEEPTYVDTGIEPIDDAGPMGSTSDTGTGPGLDSSSDDGPIIPVCGDGIADPGEDCDGEDLAGTTCEDFGRIGPLGCLPDCSFDLSECISAEPICGDGVLHPREGCEGNDFGELGFAPECEDVLGDGLYGEVTCTDCGVDTSGCGFCGDGVVQDGFEQCDTQGEPFPCELINPAWEGTAFCFDCLYETAECTNKCGNGTLDDGEACDGMDLGGTTCDDLGFVGGTLACAPDCEFSTAACETCGNGVVDPGESCDGNDLDGATCSDFVVMGVGALGCDDTCEFVIDECEGLVPLWDGDAIITELMVAPLVDPNFFEGEWIEVHNPDPMLPFDLQGCQIQGLAAVEAFTIQTNVLMPPGGYATLGRGTPDELGFVPDYSIPNNFALVNSGDMVRINCGGTIFDQVMYDDEEPWPGVETGIAIATTPDVVTSMDNDDGLAWCLAPSEYAPMMFGSPGAPNDCG